MLSDDLKCEFLHVIFSWIAKHHPVFFTTGLFFVSEKWCMQKDLRFPAASFGDCLLHGKQKKSFVSLNNEISEVSLYSATTWTGPLRTKLTNQSVNWEQRMATVFLNGPMKLKNSNNGLTTKIWNPTKLRGVADVSGNFVTFWLVRFDPIFWNVFRLFNVSNGFGKL